MNNRKERDGGGREGGREGGSATRKRKIRSVSGGHEKGRIGERKMRYYEFIPGFRGRYKSLFGFEYSILKHPSRAGIDVPSIPIPGPLGDGHS
jgi:hypothetical protein